jgi:hypothetical protein
VDLATLDKGRNVITIIEVNQIWCVDNKFGVSVRLMQVLFATKSQLKGFSFVGVDDVLGAAPAAPDSEEEIDVPDEASGEEEDV